MNRGFVGPSVCMLCQENDEMVEHLMVHCRFSRIVWDELKRIMGFPSYWGSTNVYISFEC